MFNFCFNRLGLSRILSSEKEIKNEMPQITHKSLTRTKSKRKYKRNYLLVPQVENSDELNNVCLNVQVIDLRTICLFM